MNLPHSVAEIQAENVTLELEGIARMCLNCYVPQLTSAGGVAAYFRNYKGHRRHDQSGHVIIVGVGRLVAMLDHLHPCLAVLEQFGGKGRAGGVPRSIELRRGTAGAKKIFTVTHKIYAFPKK